MPAPASGLLDASQKNCTLTPVLQPTLPVLRRLAIALGVSGDALLFDQNERGPGDDLRLHFEAVARMSAEDQQVVRSLLEGMILKHDAKRFVRSAEG